MAKIILPPNENTNLSLMSINCVAGLIGHSAPSVPDHELVVVADAAEQRLVQQVPSDVLHNGSVTGEDGFGVDDFVLLLKM